MQANSIPAGQSDPGTAVTLGAALGLIAGSMIVIAVLGWQYWRAQVVTTVPVPQSVYSQTPAAPYYAAGNPYAEGSAAPLAAKNPQGYRQPTAPVAGITPNYYSYDQAPYDPKEMLAPDTAPVPLTSDAPIANAASAGDATADPTAQEGEAKATGDAEK